MKKIPGSARLIRVELSYAVFGVLARDGIVIDAAPIAGWAIDRPEREVADYYRRKGARFSEVPPGDAPG